MSILQQYFKQMNCPLLEIYKKYFTLLDKLNFNKKGKGCQLGNMLVTILNIYISSTYTFWHKKRHNAKSPMK